MFQSTQNTPCFTQKEIQSTLKYLEFQSFTERMIQQFTHYLNALLQWNKAYNLTAITEKNDVLVKHLLDALVIAPFIDQKHVIDVGSGAGLPGILLAISCPNSHFHLLDSANKRTRFMQQMVLEMQLKNVTIIHSRVQDFQPDVGFDIVLSRAFATLLDMVTWSHHLPNSTGVFLALKGKCEQNEIDQLIQTIVDIEVQHIYPLHVPNLNEARHLVKIKLKPEN